MSRKYQQYMDRQMVSPELHQRLLALENQQTREKPVVRPVRWQRWAALAASLVFVVGVGIFAAGRFSLGKAAVEESVSQTVSEAEEEAVEESADAAVEADSGAARAAGAASADTATAADKDSADGEEDLAAPESAEAEEAMGLEAVDDVQALMEYATDYLGDASKVSHIAAGMTYPEGWVYDYVELHTGDNAPYGLDIHLTGEGAADFEDNARTAFTLIGNVEIVRFIDHKGSLLAEYDR